MVNEGPETAQQRVTEINNNRCVNVLPNINAYMAAAGQPMSSAVVPTGCLEVAATVSLYPKRILNCSLTNLSPRTQDRSSHQELHFQMQEPVTAPETTTTTTVVAQAPSHLRHQQHRQEAPQRALLPLPLLLQEVAMEMETMLKLPLPHQLLMLRTLVPQKLVLHRRSLLLPLLLRIHLTHKESVSLVEEETC